MTDRNIDSKKRNFMLTHTGQKFDPLALDPAIFDIRDIGRALAYQCRYNGHLPCFYSIAQHSVMVADMLPDELKQWGLLHDATEAYMGDVVFPVKALLPEFKSIENKVLACIVEKFGLNPKDEPKEVKQADLVALAWEMWNFNFGSVDVEFPHERFDPWSPDEAHAKFMRKAAELGVLIYA